MLIFGGVIMEVGKMMFLFIFFQTGEFDVPAVHFRACRLEPAQKSPSRFHATILVGSPASLHWLIVILIALCSIKSPISTLHELDNKGFCCDCFQNNYNNFGESIEENPTCVIMYTNWVVPPPSEWRPQTSQSSGMPFTFNFYILLGGKNPIYYINHRQSLTTQSIS